MQHLAEQRVLPQSDTGSSLNFSLKCLIFLVGNCVITLEIFGTNFWNALQFYHFHAHFAVTLIS